MRSYSFVLVAALGLPLSAGAAVFNASNDAFDLFHGHVDQANVLMAPGNNGVNSCVPTATANSLNYLDSIGGFGAAYGGTLIPTTVTAAATDMGANYMSTSSATGTSQYRAMSGTYSGVYGFTQIAFPTWQFMFNNLNDSAAITLAIVPLAAGIGHCISLETFSFNDANTNLVVDNGELTIGVIDPSNPAAVTNVAITGINTGAMTLQFFGANYYIRGALAIVPGPETAALLMIGVVAVGRRRR
jgi:hypothetical protein